LGREVGEGVNPQDDFHFGGKEMNLLRNLASSLMRGGKRGEVEGGSLGGEYFPKKEKSVQALVTIS